MRLEAKAKVGECERAEGDGDPQDPAREPVSFQPDDPHVPLGQCHSIIILVHADHTEQIQQPCDVGIETRA